MPVFSAKINTPSAKVIVNHSIVGDYYRIMPCWYYDKKELRDTPSILLDKISFDTERRYRKEGARFIMNCGTQMGLGHNTMATGVVYFHRFYMFHSFQSFPRYVTACCCLFLAGKVEETPKKCRDIIKTARSLLSDKHFFSFGDDPKEEVMTLERILLQTIKFDLQVEHPYTFLLKYAKCFKGDQQKLQKMVQMAWNFVNDSLSTVVCLQWEPEIIAVALIHLASKLSKFTVVDWIGRQPHHLRWWDMFVSDVTMEIIEDICHQVLDLYQSNQKDTPESASPPQKPPSRADSPVPMKASTSSVVGTLSPAPVVTAAAVVTAAISKPKPISTVINATTVPLQSTTITPAVTSSSVLPELNNIQTIKSLAAPTPAAVPTNADAPTSSSVGAAQIASSTYHMYAPPPPVNPLQMHAIPSIYNTTTPAPPQPPVAPLVPNLGSVVPPPVWSPALTAQQHYNNPPPSNVMQSNNSSGGGYYQNQGYGRQQRY